MATAPGNSAADDALAASPQQVNVLVVIDTEYVKAHYPPNSSWDSPPGIDHNSQFMICTGSRGDVTGQGSADRSFKANVGDNVSFTGVSIYDNSDDAVIVYGSAHEPIGAPRRSCRDLAGWRDDQTTQLGRLTIHEGEERNTALRSKVTSSPVSCIFSFLM